MFKLSDFIHLPQLDALIEALVQDGPGLVVMAGLDPRPSTGYANSGVFLPSGRSAIFEALLEGILAAQTASHAAGQNSHAVLVAQDRNFLRFTRDQRRRIQLSLVNEKLTYAAAIQQAAEQNPHLLIIDRLNAETAQPALQAALNGQRVLAPLDTVLRGARAARQLFDLGVPRQSLAGLSWIVYVQRHATLCAQCKQPVVVARQQILQLNSMYPQISGEVRELLSASMMVSARAGSSPQAGQFLQRPRLPRLPRHRPAGRYCPV
jgi:hypothetical protein